jgi:hypothetical protein
MKWKEQPTTSACPGCGKVENARHLWLCQEPAVFFVWVLLMFSFSAWLEAIHTANDVTFWVIQLYTERQSPLPLSRAYTDMPGLMQAIDAQDCMGWLAFFEGCIAVEWAGVQEAHFIWLGHRNAGKCWATSLILKLWEISWDLSDHRNQVKHNLETAQHLACRDLVLLAVLRSEYAFSHVGLPRGDWRLFKHPLLSLLDSGSLHYLDAWLLRITRSCQNQRLKVITDNTLTTAEENLLLSLTGPRPFFQHFLESAVSPS